MTCIETDIAQDLNELLGEFPDVMVGSYPRFSEEGFQLVISSRQSFQASSASLFAGSNPVPER